MTAVMTNQAILTKAIQKAIDGGWDAWGWPDWAVWTDDYAVMFYDKSEEVDHTKMVQHGNLTELNSIIFNHDFAKALWGEEPKPFAVLWTRMNAKDGLVPYFKPGLPADDPKQIEWVVENHQVPAWQWHIQQMVIADDPIKYLGENT